MRHPTLHNLVIAVRINNTLSNGKLSAVAEKPRLAVKICNP